MVTALTLRKDWCCRCFFNSRTVVAVLACEPGCHGTMGAKKVGGYLAYVTSKFANNLPVVDPDPNNDGDGSDAHIAGSVVLTKAFNTETEDRVDWLCRSRWSRYLQYLMSMRMDSANRRRM